MKFKLMAVIACTAALYSCDDSTSGVGDFVSNIDKIEAFSSSYEATSKTYRLDSIYSRTNRAYLGKYTDPDFGEYTASFITQINCPEGFEFPEHLQEITSATLELYYNGFYGDSLATLTVQVDELNKVINDEDTDLYYTSFDPSDYYSVDNEIKEQKSYAAVDKSVSDSLRNSEGYYPNVKIDLGDKFKTRLQEASNHPEYFKDAYSFINNVLKGFYVHTIQGDGSVIYIQDIWLRINMDYMVESSTGAIDSLVHGSSVLAASKEVLMATNMTNTWSNTLEDETGHTYLKTPAGLCTEITLPINDIYDNHKNDTLNSVTLSIKKYRYINEENADKSQYKMGVPKIILMVRKGEMKDFFEKNKTYDNETSFLGTYDSSTNSYTFSKLNRLISHIFTEKRQRNNDADRDVVVLIPVTTETDTEGNIIGVSHDMEVNAARLFGGEDGEKLKMEVIYTRP